MTYSTGGIIQASDINSLLGAYASNVAYPNSGAANNALCALYGIGYGNVGYGQTAISLAPVTTSTTDSAAQWSSLSTVLGVIASHTNTTLAGLPLPSSFTTGSKISTVSFNWANAVQTLFTNRANVQPSQLVTTTILSDSTTLSWNSDIYSEVLIDFGVEDAARFFFNSGSNIQIAPTFAASGGDAQSLDWQNLATAVGRVIIGPQTTTQTGSGGSGSSVGYYNLTTSYQSLFTQYSSGTYSMNYIEVRGRCEQNNTPVNGGNGHAIRLQIYYHNKYTGSPNIVEGTTAVQYYAQVAGAPLSISTPNILNTARISGTGGLTYFTFNDTISTTVYNYNLLNQAISAGYPIGIPLYATVTVTGTGQIGSQSTSLSALTIPSLPANSNVTISVQSGGIIAGAGGNGGPGNSIYGTVAGMSGTNGGNAISALYPFKLLNYGTIGGGGGGGGGSDAWYFPCGTYCGITFRANNQNDPGGNGGGGAGLVAGLGNTSAGPNSTYHGQNGSLLYGGAGGTVSPHGGDPGWSYAQSGGQGGNLGLSGQNGTGGYISGSYPGGSVCGLTVSNGGNPGFAIVPHTNVLPGSVYGTADVNVKGNTDFFPILNSQGGTTQYDFQYGSPGSITTTFNYSYTYTSDTPVTWSISPANSNGISSSIVASGDGTTASVTLSSSSVTTGTINGFFIVYAVTTNGVVGYQYLAITHTYIQTPVCASPCVQQCNLGNGGGS